MKDSLDMKHFAAVVEQYITPLLEDSVSNEEEVYEMNTKHTLGPWHIKPKQSEIGFAYKIQAPAGSEQRPWTVAYILTVFDDKTDAANAALIATAPRMATELTQGRAALCALRYWVPEDLLPAVNAVIASMARAIGKATGDCPPEADGRTEKAARAAIEEATK